MASASREKLQAQLLSQLSAASDFSHAALERNVRFFVEDLGLPDVYYDTTPLEVIGGHIISLSGMLAPGVRTRAICPTLPTIRNSTHAQSCHAVISSRMRAVVSRVCPPRA